MFSSISPEKNGEKINLIEKMQSPYSNTKATLALAKASFRSIMRSPSAVVFTLAFPLIFILVFGFLGGGGTKLDIAVAPGSDLQNPIIASLEKMPIIRLKKDDALSNINKDLEKGNYDALINVEKNKSSIPAYFTTVKYTSASLDKGNILKSILNELSYNLNTQNIKPTVTEIRSSTIWSTNQSINL
jgi:ABC-2 type transport system permease protein